MAKPANRKTEDTARVDSFRTDEDTGGAAAPPLRPRDEAERPKRRDEPAKPSER
jgi:hypothetical protein